MNQMMPQRLNRMTHDADLTIAVIGPEGAALLAALHGQCFDRPWNAIDFATLLALPTVTAMVAERVGGAAEPVGIVLFQSTAETADILTIGVLPANRCAGIGGLMLAKACAALSARGVRDVFLEAEEGNLPALRLYRASGFCVVDRHVGYYESMAGGAGDAISLRLALGGRDG